MTTPKDYLVPVGRKYRTLVSAEDFEVVSTFRWLAKFCKETKTHYAARFVVQDGRKRLVFLHRFLLGLTHRDGKIVDHINGDTLDNRRSNLRIVTSAQNSYNSKIERSSLSGVKGVIPRFKNGKQLSTFRAYIYKNYKRIDLGSHPTIELAIAARRGAEIALFGEYRRMK